MQELLTVEAQGPTVSSVSGGAARRSSMTNATVAGVANDSGERRLTLTYKGGQQIIVVPNGPSVMTTAVANASLLVPGTHVAYATTQPDGALTADRVSIGNGGYIAPL